MFRVEGTRLKECSCYSGWWSSRRLVDCRANKDGKQGIMTMKRAKIRANINNIGRT
jgi:hypothetical protein